MAITTDNIIQRILLEGDKVITASLTQMGAAGEKAFAGIGAAANATNKILASIGTTLQRIAPAAQNFGRTAVATFQRGAEAVGNFASNVTLLGRRMLVLQASTALVTGALVGMVKGAADAADKILETADALALTTQRYQELTAGAQEAGVSEDQFTRAMSFLTRTIEGSQREIRQFRNNVDDAGVSLRRTTSDIYRNFRRVTEGVQGMEVATAEAARDTALSDAWRQNQQQLQDLNRDMLRSEDVFRRYNIQIARMENGSIDLAKTLDNIANRVRELGPTFDRASLAQQLFGTRNQRMVNLLSEGSEGLKRYAARGRQLGQVVDELSLKIGARLSDAFDRLNVTMSRNRIVVLRPLIIPLTDLVDAFSDAIARNAKVWQAWIQTVADKVAPIIEDIISLLEGREQDVKMQWIIDARDSVIEFATAVGQAFTFITGVVKAILAALQLVADTINLVFGTKLTGTTLALILIFTKLLGLFGLLVGAVKLIASGFLVLAGIVGTVTAAVAVLAGIIAFVLVRALLNIDWAGVWQKAVEAFNGILAAAKNLWAAIVKGFDDTLLWIQQKWTEFTDFVKGLWTAIVEVIKLAWQQIVQFAVGAWEAIKAAFIAAGEAIKGAWTGVFTWFETKIKGLIDWFRALIDKAREFIGMQGKTEGTAPATRARGGPIYGPGTETSDSILARLSRGEFVINAKAVRRYGLQLMHALNSMRLPRGALKGFDAGGLVAPLRVPMGRVRFAEGGAVAPGSQRIVNLTIDGQEFPGLMAPEHVADNLVRFATVRAVRSAGKRPGWYGGRK